MPSQKSPFASLPPFNSAGDLHVIVETRKGSRNKYKYDPKLGLFSLAKVLPAGLAFPFDFGYIPSTKGKDGDPLDVLLLMEEPTFPGCLVVARLIGAIQAEQTKQGAAFRNDRLIAVAAQSQDHQRIQSIADLSADLLDEIEYFFRTYLAAEDQQFQPQERLGVAEAIKLVEKGSLSKRRKGKPKK
ncbi:MAG: inorganic diphosphatase [Anaerolineae bacterium]|nr:inorganic diphosphatase [Anaerolineae bacterium]